MIQPPAQVALIGLGLMGLPMALNLRKAGYAVRGADLSADARKAFTDAGGEAFADAREAARGVAALIAMLPDGRIVAAALLGEQGAAAALEPGTLVIDMSSSAPTETLDLGRALSERGLRLIDAPVSGGVRRARDGSLSIIAGGEAADIDAAEPLLLAMGKSVFRTGRLGSGHAMKALNNYVSAAGLVAASEALLVGQAFGLAPETIIDVLNASTGRNNSTDVKMKQFVISRSFAAGFSMGLMAKDLRTAADLARHVGVSAPGMAASATFWTQAAASLGASADHTEIIRALEPKP